MQYFGGVSVLWSKKELEMKKILLIFALIISAAGGFSSCTDIDCDGSNLIIVNAIVTVKHTTDGTVYFQLDDHTTLRPDNASTSSYGNEQYRALIGYRESDEKPAPSSDGVTFDKLVHLYSFDKVLTKSIVESQGDKDDEVYGTAPVEILSSWATIIEDGYITLVFSGYWGDLTKTHKINLVSGVESGDPYLLELRHDACDDNILYDSTRCNGIAAFDLNSLPDTTGETVKLTIRFISFSGEKTVSFDYCTGKTSQPDSKSQGADYFPAAGTGIE